MLVGYARVSTEDQKLDLQRDALEREGCVRIFEEKVSGAKSRRPSLEAALQSLRTDDVLVVWRLDRLGRSLRDLIDILSELERRQIHFRSISDRIDTTTPVGRLVFHIAGAMAEFERALISERTRAGMAAARRKGRSIGRPRSLTREQIASAQAMAKTVPLAEIARRMRVGKTTVRRALARCNTGLAGLPDSGFEGALQKGHPTSRDQGGKED